MQKKLTYGQKISMVAAVSLLGLSLSVDAAVVYKDPTDIAISADDYSTVGWDIDANGKNDFNLRAEGTYIRINGESALNSGSILFDNKIGYDFSLGDTIGQGLSTVPVVPAWSAPPFFSTTPYYLSGFSKDQKGHLGFKFNIDESSHYGWASITIGSGSLKIHDWAYNDVAGQSINAGDTIGAAPVPLPPSAHLMLLALGAGGLTQWRSRRKAHMSAQKSKGVRL